MKKYTRRYRRRNNRRSKTRSGGIARNDLETQLVNLGFNTAQINNLISNHAPELADDYAIEGWLSYIRNQVPNRMTAFQFMEMLGTNSNSTNSSLSNSLRTPPVTPPSSPPRNPIISLPSPPVQDRGPMTMDELGPRSPVGVNANFDDFQMGGVNFKTVKPKAKSVKSKKSKKSKPRTRTRSTTSSDFGSIYATSSSSPSIGYFMMERRCSSPIVTTSSDEFASIYTSSSKGSNKKSSNKKGGEPVVPRVDENPYAYQEPYYDDNMMMGKY